MPNWPVGHSNRPIRAAARSCPPGRCRCRCPAPVGPVDDRSDTVIGTYSHSGRVLGVALAALLVLCGCSVDPSDHALPGAGVRGPTYRLNLEFESLLSLPAGADVRSGGISVGTSRSISLEPDSAVAHVDVRESVVVPAGTRAELRQNTVLGDIYIALLPPEDGSGPRLEDGDTIPLRDTDPGPQIEDMLARIAMFVNGGSLTRLQDSIARLNEVLPADPAETRELSATISTDLSDAAANLDQIDRIVVATDELSRRLDEERDRIGFLFSDTARNRLERVPYFMDAVLNIVIDVNTMVTGLEWLIPRLPHINENLELLTPLLREPSPSATELRGNAAGLVELVNEELVPFLLDPGVDIRQVTIAGNEGNPAADGLVLLRMIGALP
ncbi:MCE family protein [Rhodococcus zopfii]|uniref:MCE family protein n=1 Tax=Rhodococcus zopfii TaxID=43772 RepID=A0ABU3WNL0_9NOCA|nr:MCE family protein [Rhodococcus zopfii]